MNLALDRIHTQVTHTCATSLFVGFAMLLPVQNSAAQTEIDICGQASLPTVAASVPTAGEYRALVVFVKFDGDTSTSRDWPDTLTAPPDFADSLIASSPDPASYTGDVFPEHTITRYFYDQSNALDPFILYGDIYEDVIVTDSTEYAYYNQDASGNQQVGGFGFLTLEVLSEVVLISWTAA